MATGHQRRWLARIRKLLLAFFGLNLKKTKKKKEIFDPSPSHFRCRRRSLMTE
ncbi:hypothetical protein E1A91_A12G113100v1 [Gossypium mustelinum]|uniref:Uncharacterized protein n=1 Tax=Gossypium mustelinum TaxID=34275 RepID=A0A5D2WSJ6_GOSMU|nr:hypothetical protein E1A91_A12G113100v1 [Gossypium mustelinum]